MWNKKAKRSVDPSVEELRSQKAMLGKVFAGFVGARLAESAGKSGLLGAATGLVIGRIARRSPMGAVVMGGLWFGKKLYDRNKQREYDRAARNAKPVGPASAKPTQAAPDPGAEPSTPVTPPSGTGV